MKHANNTKRQNARKDGLNPFAFAFYAVLAIAIILLIAFVFEYNASSNLSQMISKSVIINPPIRFFVGTVPINVSGITRVPANQTFCPENKTIMLKSNAMFSYNYYTALKPDSVFTYYFASNSSNGYTHASIDKPFGIVSYSQIESNQSVCAGYPNARYELKVTILAPSNYTGPLYLNLYR